MKSGKSKEEDAERVGDNAEAEAKENPETPPAEKHEPSDGSEKVEPKKGKGKKEKGEKGSGKGPKAKNGKDDVKAPEPESLDGKPKKRKAKETTPGDEKIPAATFARRNCPKTSYGKCKWEALKNSFNAVIKPHLTHYSAHEEGLEKLVGWGLVGSPCLLATSPVLVAKQNNM